MVCNVCGASVSTNALARSSHERGAKHRAAVRDRRPSTDEVCDFLDALAAMERPRQ
jgi:hypothetical protein